MCLRGALGFRVRELQFQPAEFCFQALGEQGLGKQGWALGFWAAALRFGFPRDGGVARWCGDWA